MQDDVEWALGEKGAWTDGKVKLDFECVEWQPRVRLRVQSSRCTKLEFARSKEPSSVFTRSTRPVAVSVSVVTP